MKTVREFAVALFGFAEQAHIAWRKTFQTKSGVDARRDKPTLDGDWLAANEGKPYCDAAAKTVNINLDFDLLPADWQAENINQVNQAVALVALQVIAGGALDEAFVEAAAAEIHSAWVLRQRAVGKDSSDTWFKALAVPYSELPEDEKEKDRLFVRKAIDFVN